MDPLEGGRGGVGLHFTGVGAKFRCFNRHVGFRVQGLARSFTVGASIIRLGFGGYIMCIIRNPQSPIPIVMCFPSILF